MQDFAEWLITRRPDSRTPDNPTGIYFNVYDRDRSGHIDLEELEKAVLDWQADLLRMEKLENSNIVSERSRLGLGLELELRVRVGVILYQRGHYSFIHTPSVSSKPPNPSTYDHPNPKARGTVTS